MYRFCFLTTFTLLTCCFNNASMLKGKCFFNTFCWWTMDLLTINSFYVIYTVIVLKFFDSFELGSLAHLMYSQVSAVLWTSSGSVDWFSIRGSLSIPSWIFHLEIVDYQKLCSLVCYGRLWMVGIVIDIQVSPFRKWHSFGLWAASWEQGLSI